MVEPPQNTPYTLESLVVPIKTRSSADLSYPDAIQLNALVQQAENQRRQGNFMAAYRSYRAILKQRVAAIGQQKAVEKLKAADLVVVEQTADLAVLFGDMEVADSLLHSMVSLNAQAGNSFGADYAQLKRIHISLQSGLLRQAHTLLKDMEPTIGDIGQIQFDPKLLSAWEQKRYWPGTDNDDRHVLFSRLYLIMGQILAALGQYREAYVALEQGLTHSGDDKPHLAKQAEFPLQISICSVLLEKGELKAASEHLQRLELGTARIRQPSYQTRVLELSGKINLLHGELGEALSQFKEVIEICQQRNFSEAAQQATLNLARVLIYLNQTSIAKSYLLDLYENVAGDELTEAKLLALLEIAQSRASSLTDGTPIAPTVSQMQDMPGLLEIDTTLHPSISAKATPLELPQSPNYLVFFEDRALAFYWLLGEAGITAAADYLIRLEKTFAVSDSTLIHARLEMLKGTIAYYQGHIARAKDTFSRIRPVFQAQNLKPELWQLQRFLVWCQARDPHADSDIQSSIVENEILLGEITDSLSPEDQGIFLLNKWTSEEEYIADEINQLSALKKRSDSAPWYRKPFVILDWKKKLHQLLLYIDRYKGDLAGQRLQNRTNLFSRVIKFPLWKRLLFQARDRLTLSYLVLPDRILVVKQGWLSLNFGVSSLSRIQIRDLIRNWHELYKPGGRASLYLTYNISKDSNLVVRARKDSDAILKILSNGLQIEALLRDLPKRIKTLNIIPDDALHGFPFAALPYNGKFLIEHYPFTVGYKHSGTLPKVLPGNRDALFVGVSMKLEDFFPLPGVKDEMEIVQQFLSKHTVSQTHLMDKDANKETVINGLSKAIFFHIACHGTFESNRPDASGFVLPAADRAFEILSLRDLSRLDLAGLEHITLSSCWAADHFILPGRWIISLPETLCRAGAQSVLGCLWEVDDRVTVPFLQHFYSYLEEYPRDEALRYAQLDCLQGKLTEADGIDTDNPIFWAGFNLYGHSDYLKL